MRNSAVAAQDVAGGLLGLRSTGHSIGTSVLGGLLGGLAGAATGVLVTDLIKWILAVVSSQALWVLIAVPLVGLTLAVLILQGYDHGKALQTLTPEPVHPGARGPFGLNWRDPRDVIRADLTADAWRPQGRKSVSRGG